MVITQILYARFTILSVEEEEEDGKLKVILRVYAMVTVWIHSTAKLHSTIITVSCTEHAKLCRLGNTNSGNSAPIYLWNCDV
jgi:hypothetical protein